jgi:hypothetical protein
VAIALQNAIVMMMRYAIVALGMLTLGGCAEGTTLEIEALGLPGVEVRSEGSLARLDEQGRGSLVVEDRWDADVILDVTRDDATEHLRAECVPPLELGPSPPIDVIRLLVRREIATGSCALIAVEMQSGDRSFFGSYEPERFDDQPCGAFGP